MIAASVLIVCHMIYIRSVLNQSTIWQTELVVYLMIGATLIGMPYVQLLRGHVNVDLLPLALKGKARLVLALLTLLMSLGVAAIIVWFSIEFWHTAYARQWRSDTVWGVRLWIPYFALPVGFVLLLLQYLSDLIGLLYGEQQPFDIQEDQA